MQSQDYLYSFNLDIRLKDSDGIRTISVPVSEKTTKITVKAKPDAELTFDPDVKLLFRIIKD
ncbi:MAG: hypothetical protein NTZ85_03465 [Bacteroidia bacterium]|nr:hypothetical protein [Bacteroidia bacterium]